MENQLISILAEIGSEDEVVIVDDASTDNTLEVIQAFEDPRVRVLRNPTNLGHVASFEKAIAFAHGARIALSDQDDIWAQGRLLELGQLLDEGTPVAVGAYREFGDRNFQSQPSVSSGTTRARRAADLWGLFLGRRPYLGSCMVFDAAVKSVLLPFPSMIEAHDHWLAIVGIRLGGIAHTNEVVTLRRVHRANLTPRHGRTLRAKVTTRVLMARQVFYAWRRTCR